MTSQFEIDTVRHVDKLEDRVGRQGAAGGFAQASAGGDLIGPFLNIPGMRGLWSAGSVTEASAIQDRSGQQRHLTLKTGAPVVQIDRGIIPYMAYGGAGSHSRPIEPGLTMAAANYTVDPSLYGMTVGGWFWADGSTGAPMFMSQDVTGNRGWNLYLLTTSANQLVLEGEVFASNSSYAPVRSSNLFTLAAWHFVILRWIPAVETAVFLDGIKSVNSTGPATLQVSTGNFMVAGMNNGASNLLTGRMAICFISGMALSDNFLDYLFKRSRGFFGA